MNKKLIKTKQSTRSRLDNTAVAKAMKRKFFLQKLFVARPRVVTNRTETLYDNCLTLSFPIKSAIMESAITSMTELPLPIRNAAAYAECRSDTVCK